MHGQQNIKMCTYGSGIVYVCVYIYIYTYIHTYIHLCVYVYVYIQGEPKVSVHLMITKQKVTSNVQTVPRQSPDIY